MSHMPPGPFIPHVSGYTHRVRCDQARWDRSRAVYWQVLDVLWEHADSFILHEVRPELWEPVLRLPTVRPLEHPWGAQPGDLNEQGRPFPVFLGGPTTPSARQVLSGDSVSRSAPHSQRGWTV